MGCRGLYRGCGSRAGARKYLGHTTSDHSSSFYPPPSALPTSASNSVNTSQAPCPLFLPFCPSTALLTCPIACTKFLPFLLSCGCSLTNPLYLPSCCKLLPPKTQSNNPRWLLVLRTSASRPLRSTSPVRYVYSFLPHSYGHNSGSRKPILSTGTGAAPSLAQTVLFWMLGALAAREMAEKGL